VDFATLGIRITSDGVQQGADRLDDLTDAADRAEEAAERLKRTTKRGFIGPPLPPGFSKPLDDLSEAMGRAEGAAERLKKTTKSGFVGPPLPPNFKRPIDDFSESMQRGGLSAKQYAQALRLLPAQMRDSVGGFGNTLRAVASILGPVQLAVGGLAGGAAALVKAFLDGQRESQGFSSALILNGNAAGTTAGELRGLASALDEVVGTEAAASAALAQLATTGRVASGQLGLVAEAALRLQRDAGAPIEETVKLFAQLGERPAEAAAKLNAQYNFLTVAVFDQIRALEEAGKVSEAAALAQETFASALIDRTAAIEGNLGTLQRAARATSGFFQEMWDSILAIGREETPEQRLAEIEEQLARLPSSAGGRRARGDTSSSQRTSLTAEATALREQIAAQREQAKAQADAAAQTRKAIADREKQDRDATSARQRAAADAQRIQKAQLAVDLADIQRALDAETQAYGRQEQALAAQRDARLISEQTYYAERRRLIAESTAGQIAAVEAESQRLAAENLTGAEALQRQTRLRDNEAEITRLRLDAIALVQQLGMEEEAANVRRERSAQEATRATEEYLDTLDRQYARELQAQGQGRRQREFNDGRDRLDDRFLDMRQGVERNRGIAGEEETTRQLAELDRLQSEAITRYEDYFQRLTEVQADWSTGASAAIQDYFDEASNVAGQVQDALGSAFRGAEDAIVRFAQTGKLNFKDLADSIIADLIRIQIRSAITSLFGGSGGGGGFLGALGKLFSGIGGNVSVPARARGGPVSAGQPYLVGERGPELMIPSRSGLIVPNEKLQGAGGPNITMNLTPAPNTDVATFAAMLQASEQRIRQIVQSDAVSGRGLWSRAGVGA
jgi:lambda family phage tail tape measure protein